MSIQTQWIFIYSGVAAKLTNMLLFQMRKYSTTDYLYAGNITFSR